MPRISRVEKVQLALQKSKPPSLSIISDGRVPSSGWSQAELSPWYYIDVPADGYLDLDFTARPPSGPASTYMAPIHAELIIYRDPDHFWGEGKPLKGVRVHATNNKIKEAWTGAKLVAPGEQDSFPGLLGGDASPWPWGPKLAGLREKRVDPRYGLADLIGRPLRVYITGSPLTMDVVPDRANIEISPEREIVDIWFG